MTTDRPRTQEPGGLAKSPKRTRSEPAKSTGLAPRQVGYAVTRLRKEGAAVPDGWGGIKGTR